ncbi:MAG TPA: FAD:protein FMN transferase [Planctomycetota bacterium]|nr:FAD:protein FMN transferase [Planctomycetota bacterium]
MGFAIALLAAVLSPQDGHARFDGMAMGSSLEIEVFGPDPATCDKAVKEAREEIDRLERIMTDWKQESPLMDVNRAAGTKAVEVSLELLFIVERSLKVSELTEGAFDITFAGAGKLWNWRDPKVPTDEEVKASLANVGWKGVVVDVKANTIFLSKPGMRIGLGGIGPGYAGDLAMEKIRKLGIRDACVNLSGDIVVIGKKKGEPWSVGITHPRKKGETIAILPVSNAAVSTSGDYERYFEKDGKRYCHIIDPRTGYPADLCQSVTIIAPNLAFADALATGVFVLGPVNGMKLVETLDGVQALIVAADGTLTTSKGLKK